MGLIQQIFCNFCSDIAPGAASSRMAAEKTAQQFKWKILQDEKHICPDCQKERKYENY